MLSVGNITGHGLGNVRTHLQGLPRLLCWGVLKGTLPLHTDGSKIDFMVIKRESTGLVSSLFLGIFLMPYENGSNWLTTVDESRDQDRPSHR